MTAEALVPTAPLVRVEAVTGLEASQEASALFGAIWDRRASDATVPVHIIRALEHSGGYAAIARVGDQVAGALLGFVGSENGGNGHGITLTLQSHILGVLPRARGRSIGFTLKQHQRSWCLERGISTVRWTFDPLVRRNAYFNLTKLGAVGSGYEPNFYGAMPDGLNAGDESDRLITVWDLGSPRALAAAEQRPLDPLRSDPAVDPGVLLRIGQDREPVEGRGEGPRLLCQVPEDIVELRRREPRLAARWRQALRRTLGEALRSGGYEATGMTRSGWYVLTRPGPR